MDSGGSLAWLLWLDLGLSAGWEGICKGLSIGVTLTMNIGLSRKAQAPHLALRQEDRKGRQDVPSGRAQSCLTHEKREQSNISM